MGISFIYIISTYRISVYKLEFVICRNLILFSCLDYVNVYIIYEEFYSVMYLYYKSCNRILCCALYTTYIVITGIKNKKRFKKIFLKICFLL